MHKLRQQESMTFVVEAVGNNEGPDFFNTLSRAAPQFDLVAGRKGAAQSLHWMTAAGWEAYRLARLECRS